MTCKSGYAPKIRCSATARVRVIPAPAAPESPEILQKDRAYQIAAAHFYAGDLAVAERLFRDIADDPASHWRPLAPYLIARALLRQGSLVPRYDDVDKAKLTAAKQTLHAILDDRILQIIHAATQTPSGGGACTLGAS